ncbi:MAG: formate--tetrahydrofolate ligase [Actinomycetes bacterium]
MSTPDLSDPVAPDDTHESLPSDLAIASACSLDPITDVAVRAGLPAERLVSYGPYLAKVDHRVVEDLADRPLARYVAVTAITPTPLGEGKTTTAVGLAQAMAVLGRHATLTIRQPSMGTTFGIKGGAAGGGWSQIVPMQSLNLHLTGDFHAVTAAHNLLAAMLDNHLHHGNALGVDPRSITWPRVLDVDDRALRHVVVGLGSRTDGVPRQSRFDITAASEVMTLLGLARDLGDLRARLGRIVIGTTYDGQPVTAEDLHAAGAMAVILTDALSPTLLQTLEHTPVLAHTGPFGNIATGNSSVLGDLVGVRTGEVLITEAGFGADMGAERLFNVKSRVSGLAPEVAVVVATVRALKVHSGAHRVVAGRLLPPELLVENPDEVWQGAANLRHHLDIVARHGVTPVVAVNAFPTDHPSELAAVVQIAAEHGVSAAVATHVRDGGKGATELAALVLDTLGSLDPAAPRFRMLYPESMPLVEKITTVAREVYGAAGVDLAPAAARDLDSYERLGYGHLPVVVAKTHLSTTADPAAHGAPRGWRLPVREVRLAAGAGYVYALAGTIQTMPGLPAHPAAERIDLRADGTIVGLG